MRVEQRPRVGLHLSMDGYLLCCMPENDEIGPVETRDNMHEPHGLILFDGVCVLCSRGCRFVSRRDSRMYFRYLPMQSPEGRKIAASLGIDPDQPNTFAYIANSIALQKSDAAIHILRELPGWRWTSALRIVPQSIRDAIYDLIARNRYRWFGRYDSCILPNADWTWPKS